MTGGIKPDYSFIREGRQLADWLWRLVDEDPGARLEAGEALYAMHAGVPSVHTDGDDMEEFPDSAAQKIRFEATVLGAVRAEGFDKPAFVRKLVAYRIALNAEWEDHWPRESAMNEDRRRRFVRIWNKSLSINSDDFVQDDHGCGQLVQSNVGKVRLFISRDELRAGAHQFSECRKWGQREFQRPLARRHSSSSRRSSPSMDQNWPERLKRT